VKEAARATHGKLALPLSIQEYQKKPNNQNETPPEPLIATEPFRSGTIPMEAPPLELKNERATCPVLRELGIGPPLSTVSIAPKPWFPSNPNE